MQQPRQTNPDLRGFTQGIVLSHAPSECVFGSLGQRPGVLAAFVAPPSRRRCRLFTTRGEEKSDGVTPGLAQSDTSRPLPVHRPMGAPGRFGGAYGVLLPPSGLLPQPPSCKRLCGRLVSGAGETSVSMACLREILRLARAEKLPRGPLMESDVCWAQRSGQLTFQVPAERKVTGVQGQGCSEPGNIDKNNKRS